MQNFLVKVLVALTKRLLTAWVMLLLYSVLCMSTYVICMHVHTHTHTHTHTYKCPGSPAQPHHCLNQITDLAITFRHMRLILCLLYLLLCYCICFLCCKWMLKSSCFSNCNFVCVGQCKTWTAKALSHICWCMYCIYDFMKSLIVHLCAIWEDTGYCDMIKN